jgi:hypothetical protein
MNLVRVELTVPADGVDLRFEVFGAFAPLCGVTFVSHGGMHQRQVATGRVQLRRIAWMHAPLRVRSQTSTRLHAFRCSAKLDGPRIQGEGALGQIELV